MRRYYITNRHAVGGVPGLLQAVERAVAAGVEMIQLREKDLAAGALLELTREVMRAAAGVPVLVNDRLDVALAAGAQGVHLRSRGVPVERVRAVTPAGLLIGVSCHDAADVAAAQGADFVVLGPVFAKPGYAAPLGLDGLAAIASRAAVPVFALGGVTRDNAAACLQAGAAGIAGISLFQDAG